MTTEAPPQPMMPTDPEIDALDKRGLLKVCESHGLPVNEKMTAKELRPWARAAVHGYRTLRTGTGTPEPEGEPQAAPEPAQETAEPEPADVPLDSTAAEHVDTVELEPQRLPGRETIPDIGVWARIEAMAKYMFKSNLRPKGLTNEWDVGIVLLAAHDLGIPPSFAMQKIHVQNGRLGMQGELMSALILRDGHQLRADVANDRTAAKVWGRRDGDDEWTWSEFTIDDAIAAGLCTWDGDGNLRARSDSGNKLPWELYTADMLYWRALARLARRHFSDCLGGISYTPDELGWAIDVDVADELSGGDEKPYGRAGEPQPTMTIGRQRSELGDRLAELPEDLQASIKEDWRKRNYPPVRDLSAAAIRTVRGWVEAAEEMVRQRESTDHIPDAEEVTEQTEGEPGPARSGDDGVEGSAAADRDATGPSSVEDRQEAGEPGSSDGQPGDDGPAESPVAASPAPDAVVEHCAGCHEPLGDIATIETVMGPEGDLLKYHADCAPDADGESDELGLGYD